MNKPRISIRIKFLSILSFLLLACIASYLALALDTFKRDKTELVFDLNRSLVSGINNEIETAVRSAKDKLELFAIATEGASGKSRVHISNLLKNDSNIVYMVAIDRLVSKKRYEFSKSDFLETYSLPKDFFAKEIGKNSTIPIADILKSGSAVWGIQRDQLPPLIGVGKAVITEAPDKTPITQYAVIAILKTDHLLQAGSHLKTNVVYVTDKSGNLLLHSKPQSLPKTQTQSNSVSAWPLVKVAMTSPLSTQVLTFQDQVTSNSPTQWMGAFSKTKDGELITYSMIEESSAFSALEAFIKRSLLFASIVATVAFIAAILFSRSLTRPLEVLVTGMQKVTAGDLGTHIIVKSNDETSLLATSFNKMIRELYDSRVQLEEINRDLEQKVKERTIQLEDRNKAVKEAQEALIRTTRLASVGEIAARAAHEVLNPLTGMMTRLNIVQKRTRVQPEAECQLFKDILEAWKSDYDKNGIGGLMKTWMQPSKINPKITLFEEDLENLLSIQKSLYARDIQFTEDAKFLLNESLRISKIVQSMRALSQVKSQKQKQSLNELLNDSVKIMGDLFYQNNIEVKLLNRLEHDDVFVDKDEFIQCTTNLLRNSLQAIEQKNTTKGGWIEIAYYLDGEKINIDFKDNGAGILPEHQNKLFESQFSTKSKEEGTGLGLNISRRFIRAVDGDLYLVKSIPNQETIFRISLPQYKNAQRGVAA